MKSKLFSIIFISFTIFISSQMQDLSQLATGEIVRFQAVYSDDEKLYGYFVLYSKGKENDTQNKFEYVILDKNLNKVSSNEFLAEKIVEKYYAYINSKNEFILHPNLVESYSGNYVPPKSKVIDTSKNTISDKVNLCFENNAFTECNDSRTIKQKRKDRKKEIKENGFADNAYVTELKNGNYFVQQANVTNKFAKDNSLKYFDSQKNLIWEYKYGENSTKRKYEFISILQTNEKAVYAIRTIIEGISYTFNYVIMDVNTGKILSEKKINGLDDTTLMALFNDVPFYQEAVRYTTDDTFYFFGANYNEYLSIGYALLTLDKNTYEIKTKTIEYKQLKSFLPKINKNGQVESGYFLNTVDAFFLRDGSVGILTEKGKQGYTNFKTTDLVYIITDENFVPKQVKTIEKEKSKGSYSDFLFSQYLNQDKDVVFYYKDYKKDDETKDKNWILYINKLVNGEFSQEEMQMSSKEDKFYIIPYVAKEGYILLREYNENEKYNQIRLEKIN